MVKNRPNGLWASQVPVDYKNVYHEKIPDDWLSFFKGDRRISIDRVADNRFILYPESSKSNKTVSYEQCIFFFIKKGKN